MFLGSAGLRPHFLLEDRMFESAHTKSRPQKKSTLLRAHFCHVNKTACLVALKFKSTEKEHTFKTTSLVALISKSTFLSRE